MYWRYDEEDAGHDCEYIHHSTGPNVLAKLKTAIIRNRFGDEDDAMEQVDALAQ